MSDWISVKDRLPEIDREHGIAVVVVYCPFWGRFIATAQYVADSNFVIWSDSCGKSCIPPTHWMPLPEPPKQ
jgi:hypothetical protein